MIKLMVLTVMVLNGTKMEAMVSYKPLEATSYEECARAGKSIMAKIKKKYPQLRVNFSCHSAKFEEPGVNL